jgi:hypothetical protein
VNSRWGAPRVDEDATSQSKDDAERFLKVGIDITGTPAAIYLSEVRRIDAPYPDDLKYVEDARTGEGALLAPLYVDGRVVAVQLTYVDRQGGRSVINPIKQRFSLEKAPGAAFIMPFNGGSSDEMVCDGLEDSLTVYRYGAVRCRVRGLPGTGALKHQKFAEGTKVTIVADGDPPDSKGAKLLQDGIDALIDQKVNVWRTCIPHEGWDANYILVNYGVKNLQVFLGTAEEAVSSEIIRLASLSLLDYGRERKAAAKKLGITLGILDRLVQRERDKRKAHAVGEDWVDVDDVRPWGRRSRRRTASRRFDQDPPRICRDDKTPGEGGSALDLV